MSTSASKSCKGQKFSSCSSRSRSRSRSCLLVTFTSFSYPAVPTLPEAALPSLRPPDRASERGHDTTTNRGWACRDPESTRAVDSYRQTPPTARLSFDISRLTAEPTPSPTRPVSCILPTSTGDQPGNPPSTRHGAFLFQATRSDIPPYTSILTARIRSGSTSHRREKYRYLDGLGQNSEYPIADCHIHRRHNKARPPCIPTDPAQAQRSRRGAPGCHSRVCAFSDTS